MKTLVLIFALCSICFLNFARAERPTHFTADVYDLDKDVIKFKFEHHLEVNGDKMIAYNRYLSAAGEELITEKTEIKNEKLISYQQTQKQTGGDGTIKIEGDKVLFSYTKDGKEKSDEEKLTPNFVTSPTLIEYMMRNFEALQKGDSLDIRFGVIDRRETVGFTLKKDSEGTMNGEKTVVIRMKPSSFVIAALVRPLYFTFNHDGTRALQLKGRLPVKEKKGNSLSDFDGRMVYHY